MEKIRYFTYSGELVNIEDLEEYKKTAKKEVL
jgi:hypothetical protein